MEDEIQKRNTDCVYFLASPLTCKKGIECEYRHSEGARLNPRDCYYWLAGNCLNPTCTFRHPPLDGRTESPVEPADLPNQSSVPVNKTGVPCYFYFNGFCNKGDRCSFMHGTTAILPTPKIPKATAAVDGLHYPENKTSGNGMVAAVFEGAPKPSETASKASKATPSVNGVHHMENKAPCSDTAPSVILAPSNHSKSASKPVLNVTENKNDFELSVPDNVLERSPSSQTSEPDSEEAADKSDTPLQAEKFVDLCPDQSSEEQVDDQVEREEWWESSPGLDVLVDNGSDGYEDNPEYLPIHDGEARRLHEHMLQYEYDDLVGYDAMEYQGTGILYEDGIYNAYDGLDSELVSDYTHGVAKPSMEMQLDHMRLQKRKRLPREVDVNGRSGVDLRDHLSKRKRIGDCQVYRNRKKRGPFYPNERYPERTRRNSMEYPLSRRLASEVSNPMRCLDSDKESEFNGIHRRSRLRQYESKRSKPKPRDKERRQQTRPYISSEVSRGPMSREVKPTQEHALFTGPKTLAQIKEEKRKARMNEDSSGNTRHQGRATSEDFEGPKPLSKILNDKRVGSMSENCSNTKSKRDHVERERNHDDYFDEDGNDFVDEYEEDDDGFKKKLASIFS